jgi:hypothetical protein
VSHLEGDDGLHAGQVAFLEAWRLVPQQPLRADEPSAAHGGITLTVVIARKLDGELGGSPGSVDHPHGVRLFPRADGFGEVTRPPRRLTQALEIERLESPRRGGVAQRLVGLAPGAAGVRVAAAVALLVRRRREGEASLV